MPQCWKMIIYVCQTYRCQTMSLFFLSKCPCVGLCVSDFHFFLINVAQLSKRQHTPLCTWEPLKRSHRHTIPWLSAHRTETRMLFFFSSAIFKGSLATMLLRWSPPLRCRFTNTFHFLWAQSLHFWYLSVGLHETTLVKKIYISPCLLT